MTSFILALAPVAIDADESGSSAPSKFGSGTPAASNAARSSGVASIVPSDSPKNLGLSMPSLAMTSFTVSLFISSSIKSGNVTPMASKAARSSNVGFRVPAVSPINLLGCMLSSVRTLSTASSFRPDSVLPVSTSAPESSLRILEAPLSGNDTPAVSKADRSSGVASVVPLDISKNLEYSMPVAERRADTALASSSSKWPKGSSCSSSDFFS